MIRKVLWPVLAIGLALVIVPFAIGMPGKTGIDGSRVQEYFEQGRLDEIHRYCRSDVIQTYFLFLRVELMRGRIDENGYRAACDASAHFLDELRAPSPQSGGVMS